MTKNCLVCKSPDSCAVNGCHFLLGTIQRPDAQKNDVVPLTASIAALKSARDCPYQGPILTDGCNCQRACLAPPKEISEALLGVPYVLVDNEDGTASLRPKVNARHCYQCQLAKMSQS